MYSGCDYPNRSCLYMYFLTLPSLLHSSISLFFILVDELVRECDHLCGKKVSILRKSKADDMLQFSWEKLQSEWKEEAPTLYRILTVVVTPRLAVQLHVSEDKLPSICVAGSILLRSYNQHVSALQHLIGLILFHGNVRKQVTKWQCIDVL